MLHFKARHEIVVFAVLVASIPSPPATCNILQLSARTQEKATAPSFCVGKCKLYVGGELIKVCTLGIIKQQG